MLTTHDDITIRDPATGAHVGSLPSATHAEIEDAMTLARRTFPMWRHTAAADRGAAVRTAAAALRADTARLAEIHERETGKPVVNSNQAVLWACLQRIGGDTRVPGLGRLFAQSERAAA